VNYKNKYKNLSLSLFRVVWFVSLLFELEMCSCCNNKTVIIVEFFSYVTIRIHLQVKKSIGHQWWSTMSWMLKWVLLSFVFLFFFSLLPLINRIHSITYRHKIDQRRKKRNINDDVDFYH
jgi:hypothetical protein